MTIPAFRRTKVIMNKRQNLIHTSERMNLLTAKHRFNLRLLGITSTPPHFLLEMPMAFYRKNLDSMSDRDGFSTGEC